MTKNQLKKARERLGLSKSQMADLIRVDRATITRWESGSVAIPPIAEIAIKLTVERLAGVE